MTPQKKGKAKPIATSSPIKTRKTEPDSTDVKQSGQGSSPDFPIVGIGASAGGLVAFEAFFFRHADGYRNKRDFDTRK